MIFENIKSGAVWDILVMLIRVQKGYLKTAPPYKGDYKYGKD